MHCPGRAFGECTKELPLQDNNKNTVTLQNQEVLRGGAPASLVLEGRKQFRRDIQKVKNTVRLKDYEIKYNEANFYKEQTKACTFRGR